MVGFPVELRQVFLNLFGNAVQAIGSGGHLKLRVHDATDWETQRRGVCLAIVDTGSGIRAEDAKKLFQPFFSTKSSKGTGLGLWISQGIVQKYEGRISFRSFVAEGRSTTCFRIFFPVASMTVSRPPASTSESLLVGKDAARTTNGVA
jgi:signal transduction histidine kinase